MIRAWLASHKSFLITAVGATAIVALVTTMAVVSGGYAAQRMNLNDSSVWVANQSKQALGRANTQILQLNSMAEATGRSIGVVQDADTVLLVDAGSDTLSTVDQATAEAGKSVPLPPRSPTVQIAGDQVLISSEATGQLWLTTSGALGSFTASAAPTFDLGGRALTAMDAAGTLYAFVPGTKTVHRIDTTGTGGIGVSYSVPVSGSAADDSLTTVGGKWALLDPSARKLFLDGSTVDLSRVLPRGSDPVLQQPSVDGNTVYIGTSTGLIAVPLAGGTATRVAGGTGAASAPVTVDGCSYAAWSDGTTWRTCSGAASGSTARLSHLPGSPQLEFQVNSDRVLLNDTKSGASWAVQDHNELIDNWADLQTKKDTEQQVDENTLDTPPKYAKAPEPPVAVNDEFGARPGRITPLPVLLNDYDPNGNVLVIASFTSVPSSDGQIAMISNDQELQITLPDTASGVLRFQYTITDGVGGSATADVTITVRSPDQNSPPVCVRPAKTLDQAGGSVTVQVLGNCYDPDGDPMYLAGASVDAPDSVTFSPDGEIVFSDKDPGARAVTVSFAVSDGQAVGTGSLVVTVKDPGSVPIIANPFAMIGYQNEQLSVQPLPHVQGGSGTLRLSSVPERPDAVISPDYTGGSFEFTSAQLGSHTVNYTVTDGTTTATGTIRIDILAPPDANIAPIAVTHTAFIREDSSQDENVLATDIDPSGGVLLVTGVTAPAADTGVQVQIIAQEVLRITLSRPLTAPVAFHYELSNGLAQTEGTVTIVQLPAPNVEQPPIANPDSVSVRVGDTADIPVLDNDEQPDGEPLTLDPTLATPVPAGAGLLFTSGNQLRYLAPNKPGNFTAAYRVYASDGQWATATVKIAVREQDSSTNNPPVPKTVTARVLAGDTVRIPIPLDGIDPDGDSVQFLGAQTNPQKGTVIATGTDWIDYQAGDYSAGTDTFDYAVMDSLGSRATGTVRVGIAARIDGARNPVAVEDDVSVKPGRTVSVQVLANDSDPDGSPLTVTGVQSLGNTAKAERVGNIVQIDAPNKPGLYSFIYSIENERGGTSSNFIRLDVNKNAPPARPVASDTNLDLSDILSKQYVTVNVLANVFFADGPVSSLKLSLLPGYTSNASVADGKRIRVKVTPTNQIIPFEVANPSDPSVTAYAFLKVPGSNDALPQLRRNAPKLTVASEQTLTIHLNQLVVAAGGKSVRLTDPSTVRATHSNGQNLVVDDNTLTYTSAQRYFGPASISFQVTDGASATSPGAHVATLVVPITVTPRTNQPPVFNGALLDLEPGQSKTLNLVKLTSYPYAKDQGELAYAIQNSRPSGVSLSLSGQQLTVAVDENAAKGSQLNVDIGVRDSVNTGQAGRIQISVVPSTRPLAVAQPDTAVAPRGQTTTINVLANDSATNPFPDTPLRVIAVQGLNAANLPAGVNVTPSANDSVLQVTVANSAQPTNTTLQYEVADATNDPSRYVWGTVTISVQDKPAPISNLQLTGIGDGQLSFSWSPGVDNNSAITGFQATVTSASTGQVVGTTNCANTFCTVPTPGNGSANAVNVAIQAKNAIGLSTPVSYVGSVWSDVIPNAPTGLSASPLDHGLQVTWTKPPNATHASAISSYIVTVGTLTVTVPVPAGDPVGTSYSANVTDPSIGNGISVPYSVASVNDYYGTGVVWNSSSGSAIPAGPPIASPSAPSASLNSSNTTNVDLDWGGIFSSNGASISKYLVAAYTGGSAPSCASGSLLSPPSPTSTSMTVTGLDSNTTYNFIVYAYNAQGCTASAVATAIPRMTPSPPANATASVPGGTTTTGTFDMVVSIQPPGGSQGGGTLSYQYELIGSNYSTPATTVPANNVLSGGPLSYGQQATLMLRTVETYPDGTTESSGWATFTPDAVPVSTQLSGLTFDPTADQFSWTGWPLGSYRSVDYDCGGGNGTMPTTTGATLQCPLPAGDTSGDLVVTVHANGTFYQESYASDTYGGQ